MATLSSTIQLEKGFITKTKNNQGDVSVDVEARNIESTWAWIAGIYVTTDNERIDPFDEDNPGTVATRRRYYQNPDVASKAHVVIEGVSEMGFADTTEDIGLTVGDIVPPLVRAVMQAIDASEFVDDTDVMIESADDKTFHPAFLAALIAAIRQANKTACPRVEVKNGQQNLRFTW